jgi:hypothetical protein
MLAKLSISGRKIAGNRGVRVFSPISSNRHPGPRIYWQWDGFDQSNSRLTEGRIFNRVRLHMMAAHQQHDGRSLRRKFAQVRSWSLVLATLFVFLVPTIRTSEMNESGSPKERVEDATFTTRSASLLRSALHGRREALVFTSSIQARLGREELRPEPAQLAGHRLPNGLLAPMTC